ncbi:MAG: adenylate/guanylate cyclase domain-containing protein [bacterium]|nr:adenylate/guanylate cyclase domain-containing protein [bacterium]
MISKTNVRALLITIGVAVLISLAYVFGFFDSWQERIQDRFFIKSAPPGTILIIGIDDASLASLGQWPWPREHFANAISKLQQAKIVGIDVHFSEPSRLGQADDALFVQTLKQSRVPVVLPVELRQDDYVQVQPLAQLTEHARLGFINVIVDNDGILRTVALKASTTSSFSAVLADASSAEGIQRIAYHGPAKTFPIFSFNDLINNKIPERILVGSTVLIGATANSLQDIVGTPFGQMSGVEVHANSVSTLERGVKFVETPLLVGVILIFVSSFLAFALMVFLRRRFTILIVVQVLLLATLGLISILLFSQFIIIPFFYMLLGALLTAVSLVALMYVTESREKQFIRKSFQYYLMPEIIDEILNDPKKLTLGGARRKVTVFFSDIRGFTTLSESMSPETLTHIINEYLTGMTDVIMNNRGLVDKYIGDAIMAFWGAPIENEGQAIDAAQSVFKMKAELERLNVLWKERGIPHLDIGMGINTGEAIVGNMGSARRFNYTLMGDEVNFASRLEGLTKQYGVQCILSQSSALEINKAGLAVRELDDVMVKGKKEPKKIFELITDPLTDGFKKVLEHFKAGKEHYKKGEWDKAISEFKKALDVQDDGPSKVFLERTEYLKAHQPENWTGVYEFKTK